MTTTYPVAWPTEEGLELIDAKLQKGFDDLEGVNLTLKSVWKASDGTARPDPPPTLETIGVLWSFLEGLRLQLAQLGREADELESQLGNIDSIRLDHQAAQRRAKGGEDDAS
jgi:hypothetical protein